MLLQSSPLPTFSVSPVPMATSRSVPTITTMNGLAPTRSTLLPSVATPMIGTSSYLSPITSATAVPTMALSSEQLLSTTTPAAGQPTSASELYTQLQSGKMPLAWSSQAPLATSTIEAPDALEPSKEEDRVDSLFDFEPVAIEKPRTKWKTATDHEGEFPPPQNFVTMPYSQARSVYPGYHHTGGAPRRPETDPKYWNSLNEDPQSQFPFWVAAGTPAARMEPTWQDGNWYLVAPVDFKGLENMKRQGKWSQGMEYDALNSVDDAVRDLDAQGLIAPLPPPRHWKEHKSCPIA